MVPSASSTEGVCSHCSDMLCVVERERHSLSSLSPLPYHSRRKIGSLGLLSCFAPVGLELGYSGVKDYPCRIGLCCTGLSNLSTPSGGTAHALVRRTPCLVDPHGATPLKLLRTDCNSVLHGSNKAVEPAQPVGSGALLAQSKVSFSAELLQRSTHLANPLQRLDLITN